MLNDNFDRKEMLKFWAEEIIIPAYSEYSLQLNSLSDEAINFFDNPSTTSLTEFRTSWLNAYMAWQEVSMFDIGKAEEIGIRNFTNIYPTDTDLIHANIDAENFNLQLPSNFPAQGFPALDYLLYGVNDSENAIIESLTEDATQKYTMTLISRLIELTDTVLGDWNNDFKDSFINNNGSSGTASTDKMVNDFLYYYEKFLRAAKVGMPAGVFSGDIKPELVEARYAGIYSKQLFLQGSSAAHDFFNGVSFNNLAQGKSLSQYLSDIHISNNTDTDFSIALTDQWEVVSDLSTSLDDNFAGQLLEDHVKMLGLYDEMNKAVRIMKVDMMQALNIQVDFVDADGD